MDLDQRKQQILREIINSYILSGEPVGSKSLIDFADFSVSSATIRNEMNELEKMGFLLKTHTSSGRIPSNEGLKYYIATFLPLYNLSDADMAILNNDIFDFLSSEDALKKSVNNLVDFTGLSAFCISSPFSNGEYNFSVKILKNKKVLFIAQSDFGFVESSVYDYKNDIQVDKIDVFSKIVNDILSGFDVNNIGKVRLMILQKEIVTYCPEYTELYNILCTFIDKIKKPQFFLDGFGKMTKLYGVDTGLSIEPFSHEKNTFLKDGILSLLSEDVLRDGISVKIGNDKNLLGNFNYSIISVSNSIGYPKTIGILGPSRMEYSKIIVGCNQILSILDSLYFSKN